MIKNDSRALDVLKEVVRLNIETGQPVSSGLVERALNRQVSSATIRAVMKRLEQEGLLVQPHTSAGRLPTDAGFRVFVDELRAGWELRRRELPARMRRLAESGLEPEAAPQDRIKSMARLLSGLTDNIGIILGPSWDDVKALRVELYPRSLRRVLMVVILDDSRVRTGLVTLSEEHPEGVVAEAARILSRRIQGRTVGEIRAGAWESPDLLSTPASRCAAALARAGGRLFGEAGAGELELQGVAKVLEEPEFEDPEPLKALLRFIESPRTIRRSLNRLHDQAGGQVGVWIGAENPVGPLRSFSVLTSRFQLDDRPGILAVLGPRRMAYQRALEGLDLLRRAVAGH